ncbi:MAG: HAMP domain-containing sensor histidine kinase [Bacillota bacterium]|nr:HAMP domain-containing sensor histidine kinase [Bacillota bacterium]
MEHTIRFRQLIYRTCIRIAMQFFLAVLLLYFRPLVSVSGKVIGLATHETGAPGAVFFNVFSWMYLCVALIGIVTLNMRKMLGLLRREMEIVYHHSLWLETQPSTERLTLYELAETNERIGAMQQRIRGMIEAERKQKEDLVFQVSALSHDLKTPLTVILGNAELLAETPILAEQRPFLLDIVASSKRLNEYFNALIRYSKTYYAQEEHQAYSLSDVVEAVEEEVLRLVKDKSVVYFVDRTDSSAPERRVRLHLDYLLRAVSNLVHNALEHGPGGQDPNTTTIEVTISSAGSELSLSVWNAGSHLSPELLEYADRLFYRSSKGRTADDSHFGIGLAFVRRVAELHAGALRMANARGGAEFVLTLRDTPV